MLKNLMLAVLILSCTLLPTGCSQSGNAQDEQVLRYVINAEPTSLDPALSTILNEIMAELQLFDGLTRLDAESNPQPAVAASWDISADGLQYTFHLRPDCLWSNGDPVTAADFVFAWKRALDPKTASGSAYILFPIKNAKAYNSGEASADSLGVTAVDAHTLVVTLEKPTPYFLSLTATHTLYPVNPRIVAADPDHWANDPATLVGNGPFKLNKWIHNGKLEFSRNPLYYAADSVQLQKMIWPISDSQTTRLAMLENGQVDMITEPPAIETERLFRKGLLKVSPHIGCSYYIFNVQQPPFNNMYLRKALATAVSREILVTNVVKNKKQPAYAWIPPGFRNPATGRDFRDEGGNLVTEDPDLAKQYLAAAGYPDGTGLPQLTLLYSTSELNKSIAEAMQENWRKQLGLNIQIMNQEAKVFFATCNRGDFQIAAMSCIGDYTDPMSFLESFIDETNDAHYHSPAYNELVFAAQNTLDNTKRMEYMHTAEKMLIDEAIIIPIYYTTNPYIVRPYVKGFSWLVLGLADFRSAYIDRGGQHD